MSSALFWPILCVVVGLTLLFLEVFIPSGGLIGFLAIGFLAVGVWNAFSISNLAGLLAILALILLLPMVLALAVYLMPRTPLGRRMFLRPPEPEEVEPEPPAGRRLDHLIGQYGRAVTPLRPSGVVDFDGRRLDALAEEGLIPPGTLVRAVQVRGGSLVVRPAAVQTLDDLDDSLRPRATP
jgi:membrane-bound ClpP family serine protease